MPEEVWRRALESTRERFKTVAAANHGCRLHTYIGEGGRVGASLVGGGSRGQEVIWTFGRESNGRKVEWNWLFTRDFVLPDGLSRFDLFREAGRIVRTRVGGQDYVRLNDLRDDDYWLILLFRLAWREIPGSPLMAFSEVLTKTGTRPVTRADIESMPVGLRSELAVDPFSASVAAIDILLAEAPPTVALPPDPDQNDALPKATLTWADLDRHDPEEDPIGCAREYLAGYEFRLGEADRARHYPEMRALPPQEQHAQHMKLVNWAAEGDENDRAFEILRRRIAERSPAPYAPEILANEYKNLQAIPSPQRLVQSYFSRMMAWLDRVESFLGGPPAPDDKGWFSVTDAGKMLMEVVGDLTLSTAKAMVSAAASRPNAQGEYAFKTNGKKGGARRIEPHTFSTWVLRKQKEYLDREN